MNVLCEKPMALNEDDCSRMIDAAAQSGKLLQIAHCVRFWPEYATAKEIVAGGRYGRVLAATFQRLGSMPGWAADNWFADQQRSGGMAMDLHIHDTDFVQYLFGMPQAVSSFGGKGAAGQLMHIVTHYLYEDDRVVTAEGGWSMMPPFGFEMSFNIMLEGATLVYDSTRQPTLRVCTADGQSLTPQLEKADGYLIEVRHFGAMVRGEKVEEVTTLEQSRNSVRIVQAEKRSVEQGGRVVLVRTEQQGGVVR
jgi:predicted dehydrogenase